MGKKNSMMPDNVLSTTPVPARFSGARSLSVTKTIDYEDGGIDLNDSSKGLLYQRWRARLIESDVLLSARNTSEFVLFSGDLITEISISFDQNMRPALAFIQDGIAKIWWYDSVIGGMTVTEIGAGVTTPKITMDDKRLVGSRGYQVNDIILAYVRDGNLYTRVQRDRFLIETLQAEDVKPLKKIGFSRQLRLQFMFEV
jgi:hypothetical protein